MWGCAVTEAHHHRSHTDDAGHLPFRQMQLELRTDCAGCLTLYGYGPANARGIRCSGRPGVLPDTYSVLSTAGLWVMVFILAQALCVHAIYGSVMWYK